MPPLISIIVPSYNHATFIRQRIESCLNQTLQNFELILLDDSSADGSWEFLKTFKNHSKVSHCIQNKSNSGSPFQQWKKGIELAKGEIIWIAESDDWAESDFLEECVSMMNHNHLSIVMSGSRYIDFEGGILGDVITDYKEGIFDGNAICVDFMYSRNSILNASAVIFSKENIQLEMLDKIVDYKLSGDHLF